MNVNAPSLTKIAQAEKAEFSVLILRTEASNCTRRRLLAGGHGRRARRVSSAAFCRFRPLRGQMLK